MENKQNSYLSFPKNGWAICFEANGKNSYGGYIGSKLAEMAYASLLFFPGGATNHCNLNARIILEE